MLCYDALVLIFEHLPSFDLCRCARVSTTFKTATEHYLPDQQSHLRMLVTMTSVPFDFFPTTLSETCVLIEWLERPKYFSKAFTHLFPTLYIHSSNKSYLTKCCRLYLESMHFECDLDEMDNSFEMQDYVFAAIKQYAVIFILELIHEQHYPEQMIKYLSHLISTVALIEIFVHCHIMAFGSQWALKLRQNRAFPLQPTNILEMFKSKAKKPLANQVVKNAQFLQWLADKHEVIDAKYIEILQTCFSEEQLQVLQKIVK